MEKSVLVIVVFHNDRSFSDTLDCIRSLGEIEYTNYDIVIINNGMREVTKEIFTSKYPGLIYLDAGKNLGFAGGNNLGIEYGLANRYDLFLLLNNDVEVAADFLSKLAAKLIEDNSIGMVGPKTFYFGKKDMVWASGGYIIKWRALIGGLREDNTRTGEYFGKWRARARERYFAKKNSTIHSVEVDYLPASCILVKREVVEKVGKLSEDYFFAYEEGDYAFAVKRAGYQIVVEPSSHIWHKVGLSSIWKPELIYNSYRNRLLFLKRNFVFPVNLLLIVNLVICKLIQPSTHKRLLMQSLLDHIKYKSVQEAHLVRIRRMHNSWQES